MTLAFRNVDASPNDPVGTWPLEAIHTALERGSLEHWRRLAAAIRADPWGPVARSVGEVLTCSRPYGVAELMDQLICSARSRREAEERAEVAEEISRLLAASGMSRQEFARRIGTSASRLSTYLSGRVVPSAALMVRVRRLARQQGSR